MSTLRGRSVHRQPLLYCLVLSVTSVQLQALFVCYARTLVIALRLRYPAQPVKHLGAYGRWYSCAACNRFQVPSPLTQITSRVPEPAQGTSQPKSRVDLPPERPRERGPEVVMLSLQTIQPLSLLRSGQLWLGLLCKCEEELSVPEPDCLIFPAHL